MSTSPTTEPDTLTMPGVARNSLITLAVGGGTGVLYSAYKSIPVRPTALGMSSVWGFTGLLYWYTRAKMFNYLSKHDSIRSKYLEGDRRLLASSMGAGLVTGVLSTGIAFGPKLVVVVPSGVVAMSLACGLQSGYLWAQSHRLDVLLWYYKKRGYSLPGEPQTQPIRPMYTLLPFVQTLQQNLDNFLTTTYWFPIQKLSNEEYRGELDYQLRTVDTDLRMYEKAMVRLQSKIKELESNSGD